MRNLSRTTTLRQSCSQPMTRHEMKKTQMVRFELLCILRGQSHCVQAGNSTTMPPTTMTCGHLTLRVRRLMIGIPQAVDFSTI